MKKSAFPGLALMAALAATAQTPTPVPVPVREEPRHKVAFENDYIRMIDVHIAPGDISLVHVHVIPSVVVNLTNTTILSQELGKPPAQSRKVSPGDVRYAPYDEVPLTHSVLNQSADVFHVLDIELLRPKSDAAWGVAPADPKLQLAWEQKLVRVYKLHLAAGAPWELPPGGHAWLFITVTGAAKVAAGDGKTGSAQPVAAGEYVYLPPNHGLQVQASGEAGAECVLLELR